MPELLRVSLRGSGYFFFVVLDCSPCEAANDVPLSAESGPRKTEKIFSIDRRKKEKKKELISSSTQNKQILTNINLSRELEETDSLLYFII